MYPKDWFCIFSSTTAAQGHQWFSKQLTLHYPDLNRVSTRPEISLRSIDKAALLSQDGGRGVSRYRVGQSCHDGMYNRSSSIKPISNANYSTGRAGYWQKGYLVCTPFAPFITEMKLHKIFSIRIRLTWSHPDHWKIEVTVTLESSRHYRRLGLISLTILGKVWSSISCFKLLANWYLDAVFDDVDEAELALDNIADGLLYRQRRLAQASLKSQSESSRGGGRGSGNRGGHAFAPGRHSNRLISMNGNFGAPYIQKG